MCMFIMLPHVYLCFNKFGSIDQSVADRGVGGKGFSSSWKIMSLNYDMLWELLIFVFLPLLKFFGFAIARFIPATDQGN